jgi:hypothetical protein
MSKPNFQWPLDPSPQLRVVFDYLNHLSRWELDEISLLSSANFIKETLPASMGVPSRTKSEDIAFLKELQDSLYNFPLEVCFNSMVAVSPRSISRLADWGVCVPLKIMVYDMNESKGKVWVHVRTIPPLCPPRIAEK